MTLASMESRHLHEQETPDPQQNFSAGSNSQVQRPSPCPNHFQDSTTARTVLATILEIISASGNDLNLAYQVTQPCPMLKCFHFSATPMEQIHHVAACAEASKGEIRCWTCRKCHDFKRWHAVCNTLKSPVDLLRRLSNRKRGSNTSTGEPSMTKRVCEDLTILSRQESHGVDNVWPKEMEDPASLFLSGVATTSSPAQLHANTHMPELGGSSAIRPLPTPPSTRDHSWSEDSQNLIAYGDAKVAHVPEGPPPYMVSPQTTVDDYQRYNDPTGLRLGIPPVQYIHESTFMESPEDLDFPESDQAPWAHHAVLHEAGDTQVLPSEPTAPDTIAHGGPSKKSASIFSSSFTGSRTPDSRRHKQNTWPTEHHRTTDVAGQSFDSQQPHILQVDGFSALTGQNSPVATARLQDTTTEPSISKQASFDIGAHDSITVSSFDRRAQPNGHGHGLEDGHQTTRRRRPRGMVAQRDMQNDCQFEECDRCGQRFGGEPKNRRQHLKRHVASKHGGVRFPCARPGRGRSYNRVDNLHDHERKRHRGGLVMQAEVAELAAGGDVEVRAGRGAGQCRIVLSKSPAAAAVAEVEGSAPYSGHRISSGAEETHLDAFGYLIPTEGGGVWHPTVDDDDDDAPDPGASRGTARFTKEWDSLMAGVSGGQHEGDEAGFPNVGDEADTPDEDVLSNGLGLAPRPLDVPCASWRVLGG